MDRLGKGAPPAQRKYEFTGETLEVAGRTLRRIRRLSDGLRGGWIEREENLSHEGSCFVYDHGKVSDHARVTGDATVRNYAKVSGSAVLQDQACAAEQAWINGAAVLRDQALATGRCWVGDRAVVCDRAQVCDDAAVSEDAIVGSNTVAMGSAWIKGTTQVWSQGRVFGGQARVENMYYLPGS